MKTKMILTALLSLTVGVGQNESTKLSHDLEEIDRVTIELRGNIEVNTWDKDEMSLEYKVESKGGVFGFSNKDKRAAYELESKVWGRTLKITPKKRKGLTAFGIVTYSEEQRHVVFLPEDMELILKSNQGQIQVNGDFRRLTIVNKGEVVGRFKKENIGTMMCEADKRKLTINGTAKNEEYEFAGSGEYIYDIKSTKIRLRID